MTAPNPPDRKAMSPMVIDIIAWSFSIGAALFLLFGWGLFL